MNITEILTILSLVLALVSIANAVIQTVRLKTFYRIRDIDLNEIWKSQKELSGILMHHDEQGFPRDKCGYVSQKIEAKIAALILKLSTWTLADIERMHEKGDIDNHDFRSLKGLLPK